MTTACLWVIDLGGYNHQLRGCLWRHNGQLGLVSRVLCLVLVHVNSRTSSHWDDVPNSRVDVLGVPQNVSEQETSRGSAWPPAESSRRNRK